MCGIAGIVLPEGESPSRYVLEAMGAAIAHRGPDDATIRVYGRAGLSFRRLSIIDVEGGAQPLDDERGRLHVILNGEIYNHLDLRAELEAKGHRFKTRSDVETVVHGYEEHGDGIVARLRGMFALALWDEDRERLLLARDRMGQKPLVYHEAGGRLAFASELRALLADPAVPREVDLTAIHHYLTYLYVPAPLTALRGVKKLPPGHLLVFEKGETRVEPYWRLPEGPPLSIGREDAAAELTRLLKDAVKARLMSEVPLGAFLSGGIDSSTVVALMAELGPVKTFSIGFEENAFNELPYARLVAERYGTEHHEFVVKPHAAEVIPKLVAHYGEPYADSSALPTYYLARMTRQHVTVALNGDGGDELFAGYDRYKVLGAYRALAAVPGAAGVASALGPTLPGRFGRFLVAARPDPEESYGRLVSCFRPEEKERLYSEEMREAVGGLDSYQLLYGVLAGARNDGLLARTLHADLLTYLPGDLLAKVDIASMACSLEARCPFLDTAVVEFAARLPTRLKLRWGRSKVLLREAMGGRIPEPLLHRRKQGFGIPIDAWFRGELRELAEDALLSRRAAERPFFRPEAVRRLWQEHLAGRNHGFRVWSLLMLELWYRLFLDTGAAPSPEPLSETLADRRLLSREP